MTKVSSATVRLVLKKLKANSLGENPIYLSVCFNGRKEKSTGVFISQKYWNAQREEIRKNCPNAPVLNKMINEMKQRVIDRRNRFEYDGKKYTASMLLEDDIKVDLSASSNVYKNIYKEYVAKMGLNDNSIRLYDYNFRILKNYFGREDFLINDITLSEVKKLIKSLGLSDNSIRGICGRIASVWNYATNKGLVDVSDYPFRDWKYSQKYKKGNRTYYIDSVNLRKIYDYFVCHYLKVNGELFSYGDGVEDKLMKRSSREFCLLFFLMLYRLNGSAPVDAALLRCDNCSRVLIDGNDYWKVEFKRKKTGIPVVCLLKRDMLTMVGFERFMGLSNGYIYPVIKDGMSEKQITNAVAKFCLEANKHLREVCECINVNTIRRNVKKGLEEPLIDVEKVSLYSARHSFANSYLSQPGASVHGLASLMARSPDTISTYIHQLQGDKEVADAVKDLPI